MTVKSGVHCDHEGCRCGADTPDSVIRDGRQYCCEACAAGEGCDHAGCYCGRQQAAPNQTQPQVQEITPPIFPVSAIPR